MRWEEIVDRLSCTKLCRNLMAGPFWADCGWRRLGRIFCFVFILVCRGSDHHFVRLLPKARTCSYSIECGPDQSHLVMKTSLCPISFVRSDPMAFMRTMKTRGGKGVPAAELDGGAVTPRIVAGFQISTHQI